MPTAKTSFTTLLRETTPPGSTPASPGPEHWSANNGRFEISQGEEGAIYTRSEDGKHAAIGATTDSEVTGNGSVIAILKRIRTLLTQTLGVAINSVAVLVAGSDGAVARAIKTTSDGIVVTAPADNYYVTASDNSSGLAVGASETVTILAASGKIGRLKWIGLYTPSNVSATTGTRAFKINLTNLSFGSVAYRWIERSAAYNADLIVRNGAFSTDAGADKMANILECKDIEFDSSSGFRVNYVNNMDVTDYNHRYVEAAFFERKVGS